MNIAQISARALPFMGGTETHVDEVSARLVERGHQVTVMTTDPSNELPRHEVRRGFGVLTGAEGARVHNPAFDVTPASLITAIISDRGIHRPPYDFSFMREPAAAGVA